MVHQVPEDSESSRQRKQRLVYKIVTGAQTYFAENALLEDRNQFLTEINKESKPRQSTKSASLGKVREMSYKDLEKARARRAANEAAKEARKVAKEFERVATAGEEKYDKKGKTSTGADASDLEAINIEISEALSEENEPTPKL
ncbi:MAG: hypothetical protein HETSPECPRED_003711 [Heterodermia speciosa]|uniref:Uncharacterized protein n=1 Tax=Heterodermia speciosa TaxID=116794 RepID=A0A8H3J6C9_9LECA|nr:MAG: hypothetical protein HETSPECPRED_003711 [Heterodermia speciosa]